MIIGAGPGANIPGTIDVGPAGTKEGIVKLKKQLMSLNPDDKIVVYCGCCPYEHCPNVRPEIETLKQMNFTNYYLLDLPHNLKKDWIDKGFPVTE